MPSSLLFWRHRSYSWGNGLAKGPPSRTLCHFVRLWHTTGIGVISQGVHFLIRAYLEKRTSKNHQYWRFHRPLAERATCCRFPDQRHFTARNAGNYREYNIAVAACHYEDIGIQPLRTIPADARSRSIRLWDLPASPRTSPSLDQQCDSSSSKNDSAGKFARINSVACHEQLWAHALVLVSEHLLATWIRGFLPSRFRRWCVAIHAPLKGATPSITRHYLQGIRM